MIVLSQKYLNTVCQIHAPNNLIIGVGKITVIEEDHIIVSNTDEGLPVQNFLSYVKLTLQNSVEGYKVILACVTDSQSKEMRLSNLNILTDNQKRDYFRVHVTTPTRIFLCDSSVDVENQYDNPEFDEKNASIPYIDVSIKNLSLGGALIESDAFLQIGQKVVIEIISHTKSQFLLMSVRRRRRDEYEDDDSLYQYGCAFEEKSNKKMDEICRLLLGMQTHSIRQVKQI